MLGIGAAAIFPLSLSVIPVLFAPEERQKAIALMAGPAATGESGSERAVLEV